MTKLVIKNLNDINSVAKQFISKLDEHKIIALYGKMGAGKTTFIKAVCQELGVKSDVTSPTFAIVNEYKSNSSKIIFHFDLYRIKNIYELLDTGFEEYTNSDNLIFIEWPEIAKDILPVNALSVSISENIDGSRLIEF